MKRIENECVDCGLPCLGTGCKYYRVERFYCDKCGQEETLYHTDEGELCTDCILSNLPVVEGSEV